MIKNPQAFPSDFECGMTLRDYFAAKAMNGYLSRTDWKGEPTDDDAYDATIAKYSYEMADAMLKERAK